MRVNVPNLLSWLRIVLSPIFLVLLLIPNNITKIIAILLFGIASLTDYLDGYYARKLHQETKFGIFFDPLADKVLTSLAFVAFVILDIVPLWMVIIIIVRDFGTTYLRILYEKKNITFTTSYFAKVKTFVQMSFIGLILILMLIISLDISESLALFCNELIYSSITYYTMLLLTVITVWTLIDYINQGIKNNHNLSEKGDSPNNFYDVLLTTFFYSGYLPKAPGTWGSIVAVLTIVWVPMPLRLYIFIPLIIILFILSLPSIKRLEAKFGDDPAVIVIDEVLAMWLILLYPFIHFGVLWSITAFLLFRIFDIFKPYPINKLNDKKGAIYVMFDDFLAAIFTIVVLHTINFFANIFGFVYLLEKL